MKYSTSLRILARCPNFCWAIPTPRISAGNSSIPSAAARSMPAAWRACTTWAWSPSRGSRTEKKSAVLKCTSAAVSAPFRIRRSCSTRLFRRKNCCLWRRRSPACSRACGEKKNRSRARIKFLVQDLGIEKFKELVLEERKILPHDPRWTDFVEDAEKIRGDASPARRQGALAWVGSLPALGEDQHTAAEARGLRGGYDRASAGRHYRQPTALISRTSRAASRRKRSGRRSSKISSFAGSAKAI